MAKSKSASTKRTRASKAKDWRKKPRVAFDKEKLMFHRQGDYSIHWEEVKSRKPVKEVLIRTVTRLNEKHCKTYADFIQFRTDCIVPDADAVNVDIELSINAAKEVIGKTMKDLEALGFKPEGDLGSKLTVRQRGKKVRQPSKRKQAKIDKLSQLSFLQKI